MGCILRLRSRGLTAWTVGSTPDGDSLLVAHIAATSENASPHEPYELWRVPVDPGSRDPVLLRDDAFGEALQPTY